MKIALHLDGRIELHDTSLPIAETLAILDGIADDAALAGAAKRAGLSYRAIWGKLAKLEDAFGQPLAVKTKGHGTALTPAGQTLRESLAEALRNLEEPMRRESEAFAARLRPRLAAGVQALHLAASHDPLVVEAVAQTTGVRLSTCGSAEALAALRAGGADIAGCHFGSPVASPPASLQREFQESGLRAIAVFRREQGLIVAPGNPKRLRGVADIARREARFINRQQGSGTRAWFDRLLAQAHLDPHDIQGYANEEFTHQAVAAVIAAGKADVGLGVRAEAERFGLGFHPIGDETYFMILHAADSNDARVVALLRRLREAARRMAGYRR